MPTAVPAADAVSALERKARDAIAECREPMALTDATRTRSTSRTKTRAQRAADRARAEALTEALFL